MINETEMAQFVRRAISDYFADLEGEKASGIYDMVIRSVEKPLLEVVLEKVGGNQSQAATLLGINRNTLYKKMRTHQLVSREDTHPDRSIREK
jgi:Fis family transcriptional regulator